MSIAANLQEVRDRIAAAAGRAGREPGEITLVAVSKTFGAEAVREAWEAGQRDFGENRVQEALQKIERTADMEMRWHLIGHLQSNKAKRAIGPFAMIHSVDSLELLTSEGRDTLGVFESPVDKQMDRLLAWHASSSSGALQGISACSGR